MSEKRKRGRPVLPLPENFIANVWPLMARGATWGEIGEAVNMTAYQAMYAITKKLRMTRTPGGFAPRKD
jgi:hypothetical protein